MSAFLHTLATDRAGSIMRPASIRHAALTLFSLRCDALRERSAAQSFENSNSSERVITSQAANASNVDRRTTRPGTVVFVVLRRIADRLSRGLA
jgi:hypothetical protein